MSLYQTTTSFRQNSSQVQRNYYAGLMGEDCVARDYERRGYSLQNRRWRGRGGELDLVMEKSSGFVFVEVKYARNFETAARRLSRYQQSRIYAAGAEYIASIADQGDIDVRFDVALVNEMGQIEVIENAIGFD